LTKKESLESKKKKLEAILGELTSVVVAFSGGLDSSLLLKFAHDVLRDRVLAVTALSPTYPEWESDDARRVAEEIGARHMTIYSNELDVAGFSDNPPERCYYCKKELFSQLRDIADKEGMRHVIVGATLSDLSDFRPGHKAAEELDVRSPLVEAELTKDEVRQLAREYDLSIAEKPAVACLASRFPYGEKITEEKLTRVGRAERFLLDLGVDQVRVRSHGNIARIEVNEASFSLIEKYREEIVKRLKEDGFVYVTLDLEGFRTGSMNEVLSEEEKVIDPKDIPVVSKRVKVERLEDVELPAISGWKPVDPGKGNYAVYVDGCSKGNPGDAAYGYVIFAEGALEMTRGGEYLGKKTNNEAEYLGLIAALKACHDLGFAKVSILTDSDLMVKQMNGAYKVKAANLRPLWGQAKTMAGKFDAFDISHVPRGKNKAADKLANVALDLKLKN